MTMALSTPARRFLAVGLLLIAAALLWKALVAPLLKANHDATSTIERLQPLLERSRAAVRNIGRLEAAVRQLEERRRSTGGFLQGNESIAAAQLQSRLKRAVEAVGGGLSSMQVLPPREETRFRRVTVRGQATLDLAGLQKVVYDLEASVPFLFVDDIEVRRRADVRPGTDDPLL